VAGKILRAPTNRWRMRWEVYDNSGDRPMLVEKNK